MASPTSTGSTVSRIASPNDTDTGPQPVTRRSLLPEVSLLSVAVIWGVNIPIMKNGLDQMDLYAFNAVRLILSSGILATLAWREFRGGRRPAPALQWRQIFIFAALISVAYQFLFLLGISRTTSGNTGLIISTIPIWTALTARIWLKERLKPLGWFGLLAAFAGTLIVALQKSDPGAVSGSLAGNLLILAAALSWAIGTVYSRKLLTMISPMQLSASAAVIGLPFHIGIAWTSLRTGWASLADPQVVMIVVYSGIFSTGLALPMWNFGVRHAGAAQAAVFQNLVPVVAIAAAWAFRGEPITLAQTAGGIMIIGGLLVMRATR